MDRVRVKGRVGFGLCFWAGMLFQNQRNTTYWDGWMDVWVGGFID